MAAVSSVMAMAGMAAAPAAHLSSSSAFESSVGPVQQCGILRLNKAARKMNVAVRASSNEVSCVALGWVELRCVEN